MTPQTLSREEAREALEAALRRVVPDAELDTCPPDVELRTEFELDSLDFLALVEHLAKQTGRRIEEDDYRELETLESAIDFLCRPDT